MKPVSYGAATDIVRRTALQLRITVLAAAASWGVAAALVALALARVIAGRGGVSPRIPGGAAALAGVIAAASVLWRSRNVWRARRVALWVEEVRPDLRFALVTASDPYLHGRAAALDDLVVRAAVAPAVRARISRLAARSIAVLAASIVMFGLAGWLGAPLTRARVAALAREAIGEGGIGAAGPNRLTPLRVVVLAPAYARAGHRTLDDPSAVSALGGSVIVVTGAGRPDGIVARAGGRRLHVRPAGRGEWTTSLAVGVAPMTLTLRDREYARSLAVLPVRDLAPRAVLTAPAGDTVWRTVPAGTLELAARLNDDVGLGSAYFEYMVTSGSGEIFRSRAGTLGRVALDGRAATIRARLPLAALRLGPGDVVSLRAVALDRNSLTGPDTGVSDTRTLRVARADEYDSVAVGAAPPPPVEGSLLTERMLIISAESLVAVRARTPRESYVARARRIGLDQEDLRKRVYDILYQQDEAGAVKGVEGDDEALDPQLVLNRDLKEAYDAMWEAGRALMIAEVPEALPAMNRALRALDRARRANRLYLRGRTPGQTVDIASVRLTGRERGRSAVLAQWGRVDTARARALSELESAARERHRGRAAFLDALTRLRVSTAADLPEFAAAIGEAVDAVRRGASIAPALARARRILAGPPAAGDASVPWTGGWPGRARR